MQAVDAMPADRTLQMVWLSEGNRAHDYCAMNGQMILRMAAERYRQVFGVPDPQASDAVGVAAMAVLIKRAQKGTLLKFTNGVEAFFMGTITLIVRKRFSQLRARRRPTFVDIDPDKLGFVPDTEPLESKHRMLEEHLESCLNGLSPQERQVVESRRAAGPEVTSTMLGDQLNMTASHLDVVLSKARKKLKACLNTKGVSV